MPRRPDPATTRNWIAGVAPVAVLCLVHVIVRPPSQDFASGDFRSRLFDRGVYLWDNLWFGGHSLPGFGIVSPMLNAVFGIELVGVFTAIFAAVAFTAFVNRVHRRSSGLPSPVLGLALFSVTSAVSLYGGRLTFGPGIAFGVLCLLSLERGNTGRAAFAAAVSGMSSPVAAVSLVIVLAGCFMARSYPRRSLVIAALADVVPIGIVIVLFPEGGWYPFTGVGFVLLLVAIAGATWFGLRHDVVRWTAAAYAIVAVGAMVVQSALGGNIVRLAWLLAGPLAALTAVRFRRTLLPAFVVFTLVWSGSYLKMAWQPVDRSSHAAYYDSLADFVRAQPDQHPRVEVVPTESFRQADELAFEISIARGWATQSDRLLNPLFYDGSLTADSFHAWLLDHAVTFVALPLAKVQEHSRDEERVIRTEPAYLERVFTNADWQVYRVRDASPMVSGGGQLLDVQPESLTVQVPSTAPVTVKYRFTTWYRVTQGEACIQEAPGGWIEVHPRAAGVIRLEAQLSWSTIVDRFTGTDPCPAT